MVACEGKGFLMPTGFKIKTLRALVLAAHDRRAVTGHSGIGMLHKPLPAAVVLSMQARVVADLLERGLYLYEKGQK